MESQIIHKLKSVQAEKGLSDKEMAQRLGCSRQLYQMARTGKIPLGHKIIKGISVAFPELQADILIFLSESANKLSDEAKENDTAGIR